MGIGGAKYVLAVVDEYTRYLHVIPMRTKSQAASLLAQLFERVRIQVIRSKHAGILRLHTDKGSEFKSRDLESFCTWRGIVHTFTDTAAHQSNVLVERRIGLLNTGVRSCLLHSGLPHYLSVEAYLYVAHAQNLLPSHALLNRETRLNGKKRKLADVTELEDQVSDFRSCVPYLLYYRDVSEEAFGLLVEEMRPFGVRVVAYPRRDDLKHLEARGVIGFFMGPGDGPSMDRV